MYSSNMISALIMSCPGGAASGRPGVLPLPPLLLHPRSNSRVQRKFKRNKSEYPTKMKREENWLLSIVPCS